MELEMPTRASDGNVVVAFPAGNEVLFELCSPGGQVWTLQLDGTVTGFPEGTQVVNRALPLVGLLVGEICAK